MKGPTVVTFLLGALTGAAFTTAFAVASERVRRIRYDIRVARKGLKTLRKMLRRNLRTLAGAGFIVALAVLGALALIVSSR